MDPRISFSNDFADAQEAIKYEKSYREAPVSSDFEFSVRNYTMIPADEIFCKGMILPLKDNCSNQLRKMTLREELLVDEDEDQDEGFGGFQRVQNNSGWWKERLGLRRAHHIVSKKGGDRNIGVFQSMVEEKEPVFVHDERGTCWKEHRIGS